MTPLGVAIDLQALQVAGYADRGVGRYVAGFATAMASAGRVAAGLLAPELPPPTGLPGQLAAPGLVCWDTAAAVHRLAANGPVARHVAAPFLHTRPLDPDELIVSSHWAESGLPRVVTVHDLIPLRAPSHYLPTPAWAERYRARARWVASSDLVLATSEYVRREVIDVLGVTAERVVVVGAGVSPAFSPPDGTDGELFRFHLPQVERRPYILTVSGSDTRKNTERLIAAVGRLVGAGWDLHLVVVGDLDDHWRRRLTEAGRAAWLGRRLMLTGRIGDDLLRAAYRRARMMVMPSLAEGFGLPVLEAAACGCPVLASANTGLAEAAATPLATFDPTSTEAMAAAIADLLEDNERRGTVVRLQADLAARSSWAVVAERASAALDDLAARMDLGPRPAGPPDRRPRPRPRLAMVGPLPPLGGGLGVYLGRLLTDLSRRARVDAVTPMLDPPQGLPAAPARVGHVPVDAFGPTARPAAYDSIVYVLGNSDGHLPTVELALRHPGWLWLHEVRLPAIATTALERLDDDAFRAAMSWLLDRAYPGRAPRESALRAGRSTLDLIDAGVGLASLLMPRCRGVLVNSEAARNLLLVDLPPLAHHPPVRVLPPACPPPDPSSRTSAGTDDPVVVSLGVVSMAKCPDVMIDALATIAPNRSCRLAFVGPCPPRLQEVIRDRSLARGVADRVEVTGPVDDVAWRAWCDQAAMAVQLRDTPTGESSAAVLEALARGLPVITNLASAAEYPDGTVALVQPAGLHGASSRADALAATLAELLDDAAAQDALATAGLAFARDHQFDGLAAALLAATVDE